MTFKNQNDFRNWLVIEHHLQKRSASDLVCRRRKLLSYICHPESMDIEQIRAALFSPLSKDEFTKATLNGMIRAEKLFRKYKAAIL